MLDIAYKSVVFVTPYISGSQIHCNANTDVRLISIQSS
jgi:hypothetical protein